MRDDTESQALLKSISQQGVIAEAAVPAFQGMYPILRGHSNFGSVSIWPRALTFRGDTMRVWTLWTGNQITTPKGQFDRSAVQIRKGWGNYIRVAPFITERDQLTGTLAAIETELGALDNHLRMQRQLLERAREAERIGAALAAARERKKLLEQSQGDRDEVLAQLSDRFAQLLATFHFPKLSDAFIDAALIPHVRGSRYEQLGSAGTLTLVALAWELAVFELTVEQGRSHPGFLMIDSPQKGLRPVSDGPPIDSDIAPEIGTIVDRVYRHIAEWLAARPGRAQIIIVDNEPPSSVDSAAVAVRFSGNPSVPPYGLIEDATD